MPDSATPKATTFDTPSPSDPLGSRSAPTIGLAFRFHVNLYHSYRGDSLDEGGIGKDIRIIRGILDDLDRLETEGIPVSGTWDIENYYSLELYLPRYAPDIIERIRTRVASGRDEVEPMSYNNGIIPAHEEDEAERAVAWAISNPAGSGLADVFGTWAPIVRPQECMFTAPDVDLYRRNGIQALSIYYSAIPFNGFSSFVPPLPFEARYNPLTFRPKPAGPSMILLPAYNHGDILERGFSLRRWLKVLRRRQMATEGKGDLILVLDMDADDYFWEGLLPPVFARLFPSFGGLYRLARSVAGLDFVRFVRPWDYLQGHPSVAELSFGQDCADGSWDGFSSWAEKRENVELWTTMDRSRRLARAAVSAASGRLEQDLANRASAASGYTGHGLPTQTAVSAVPGGRSMENQAAAAAVPGGRSMENQAAAAAVPRGQPMENQAAAAAVPRGQPMENQAAAALDAALTARVRALSTTHYGMASPVMNVQRLAGAAKITFAAERACRDALDAVLVTGVPGSAVSSAASRRALRALDDEIDRLPRGRGSLIVLEPGDDGRGLSNAFSLGSLGADDETSRLRTIADPDSSLWRAGPAEPVPSPAPVVGVPGPAGAGPAAGANSAVPQVSPGGLETELLSLSIGGDGGAVLSVAAAGGFPVELRAPRVRYAGRELPCRLEREPIARVIPEANAAVFIVSGAVVFPEGEAAPWTRRYVAVAGLPYLFVDCRIDYPDTAHRNFDAKKAGRLGRSWDGRWEEVAPCELLPGLDARRTRPALVWKHGFRDSVSSYALDHHLIGPNRSVASINNHVTDAWLAVSGTGRGLLVAQASAAMTSFAFCPLRTTLAAGGARHSDSRQELRLNPFGTYGGPQLRYATAGNGLGRLAAVRMGNQYDPYAPSWAGGTLSFSLMIAPYSFPDAAGGPEGALGAGSIAGPGVDRPQSPDSSTEPTRSPVDSAKASADSYPREPAGPSTGASAGAPPGGLQRDALLFAWSPIRLG